jgi:FKBP-type peptidyl-prolyl cis-trans isomerase SlpA
MSTQLVENSSDVTIHFNLTLADGTQVDGTRDGLPMNLRIGDGTMIPAFEEAIIGLASGGKRQLSLDPRETFGFADDANFHWIEKEKFNHLQGSEQELENGLLIEFDTPDGNKMAGVVQEIKEDQVLVDFNHPLCGREVIFTVEVISINN